MVLEPVLARGLGVAMDVGSGVAMDAGLDAALDVGPDEALDAELGVVPGVVLDVAVE